MRRVAQFSNSLPAAAANYTRRPDGNSAADPARLRWTRRQVCCAPEACTRPAHAHHPRQYAPGLALKAPDDCAIALCPRHHGELHALSGAFKGWDRERLQAWERERIAEHQERYAAALEQGWPFERCKAPRCAGRRNCIGFRVDDAVWSAVVPLELRERVVCLECFDELAERAGVPYQVIDVFPVSWSMA
jgi:hypothetical protein